MFRLGFPVPPLPNVDPTPVGNMQKPIVGVNAHDMYVLRQLRDPNQRLSTHYDVWLSQQPSMIPINHIQRIVRTGLVDLKNFIQNKQSKFFIRYALEGLRGYYYDIKDEYKMPAEFMADAIAEYNAHEEQQHLDAAEENIEYVQTELTGAAEFENPIDNLEF